MNKHYYFYSSYLFKNKAKSLIKYYPYILSSYHSKRLITSFSCKTYASSQHSNSIVLFSFVLHHSLSVLHKNRGKNRFQFLPLQSIILSSKTANYSENPHKFIRSHAKNEDVQNVVAFLLHSILLYAAREW